MNIPIPFATGLTPRPLRFWLAGAAVLLAATVGLGLARLSGERALLAVVGTAGIAALALLLFSTRTTRSFDLPIFPLIGFGALLPLTAFKVTTALYWSDVFLVLCVPFAVLAALRPKSLEILRHYHPILLGGMAMVLGGTLGSFRSANVMLSLERLGRLALVSLAMPIVIGLVADTIRKYQMLALSFVGGAAVSTAVAWTQTPANAWEERRSGLAFHVNGLGEASTVALAFALALSLTGSRTRRIVAALCSALLFSGTLYSGSRGAMLGVWVATLTVAIVYRQRWLYLTAALSPVVLLPILLYHDFGASQNALARLSQQLRGVGNSGAVQSNQSREALRDMTIVRIEQNPVIGSGFDAALAGHSVPLQVWMTTGFLGFSGFIFIAWRCGWLPSWRLIRTRRQVSSVNWVLVGSLASYLAVQAMHLVSNPLWDRTGWLLPIMVLGTWMLTNPLGDTHLKSRPGPKLPVAIHEEPVLVERQQPVQARRQPRTHRTVTGSTLH